ncbi:MAG: hypothetical protein ACYDCC_09195 [Actinomycetota bacterium]
MSQDSETTLFYGNPTAPSAATAVGGASSLSPWGISDALPDDRIQGNPYTGYDIQWRSDLGNPPELCRPDPAMTTSTTTSTCSYTVSGTGPEWIAARINVNAASLSDSASGVFSGVVNLGSSGAIGLISPYGEMDFKPFPNDGDTQPQIGLGKYEFKGPILASGQASTAAGMNMIPHQFLHTGSWWFVGLLAPGSTGTFSFSATGSGLTCGPESAGSSVQFTRSIDFHNGLRADPVPNGIAYAGVVLGASIEMHAKSSALAFLTGGSEVTSSVFEQSPNGDEQYGWALDPPGTPAETRPSLLDLGPAGPYVFGIRRSTGGGGLLFADLNWP